MATTALTYKLTAYPRKVALRDQTEVVVKPMGPKDGPALLEFFKCITERERSYLQEDVTSPKVVNRWADELDYDRALPLLAWVGDKVVADGTLHRKRAGARKHLGEVRVVVDPDYRNRGIGTRMIQELTEIAYENDLERLYFELVADEEDDAIKAANFAGFSRLATLPNFVRDSSGRVHDLVVMELLLSQWKEWGRRESEQF